ncbi:MAG: hypothetical protein E6Q97_06755 [Desulfurellales bacterium]|nr:MAG: hypothetical protein E6Q97_06755 [Desulfurellales bacterium]
MSQTSLPENQPTLDFASPDWGVQKHGFELSTWKGEKWSGQPVFIDVETTEGDERKVVGACVYDPMLDAQRIFWLPGEATQELSALLPTTGVIGHNVKFDIKAICGESFPWGIPRVVDDTMILAYSLSPVLPSFGLKDLAKTFCGLAWPSYRDIVGKGKKKVTLDKQPEDLVKNYCAMDVFASFKLREALLGKISKEHKQIYDAVELPTYNALIHLESRGITVDIPFLEKLRDDWTREAKKLQAKMALKFGEEFNPASPKQVIEQFNRSFGFGLESSAKSALIPWEGHEMVDTLLRFRAVSKLKATYAEALLERAPIIRCTFNQVVNDEHGSATSDGIDTTRLSSSNPNLQNIPARTKEGKLIRQAFVPRAGMKLLVADYSQIEYRLLAHFSEDAVLLKAYADGVDIHKQTASIIFNVPLEEVTDQQRDLAKTINFASIYGAGAKKIAGLTRKSPEECQKFLNVYFDKLPGVRRFVQMTKVKAHLDKFTRTMFGRKIDLPDISSSDKFAMYSAERKAVNYKIQGSAAEIMKIALVRLVDENFQVLLTVHDEFLIEVKPDEAEEMKKTVEKVMCSGFDLKVPLEAKVGLGESWAEAKV